MGGANDVSSAGVVGSVRGGSSIGEVSVLSRTYNSYYCCYYVLLLLLLLMLLCYLNNFHCSCHRRCCC